MKNLNKALENAFAENINLARPWGIRYVGKTQGIKQCTLTLSQIDAVVLGGYSQEDGSFLETFQKPEWLHNLQRTDS